MYQKLELIGGSICGLRRQFSAFSCPLLAMISFLLVTSDAQSTVSTVGATVPDQTALTTIMDTINSLASTRGPTTEFQLFTTTQTVLPSTLSVTTPTLPPSTLSATTPTMPPSISTSLPSSSPLGGTTTGQIVTTSQLTGTTAATTKSLSTASATSTPLETLGSTTSRGTTLSGTSTQSQSETVSTSLATEIKDNSTEQTIATSSSAVTMATTGIPGPSDALSIIEWFLVAVAVAALIFFLYILYHFCQVKRKRKASAFSEQNKNIIEYATPQSPKEKWRNSWALEAMVYHIELPQETTAEMEARDNVVFEDETDTGGASNHVKPHLTKL